MLEGLEATEVRLSECFENKDFRTDSSFYTAIPFINPNLEYRPIGECLLSSQYGISISMNEEGKGFPIYRMNEIHNLLCDLDVSKFADISLEELTAFVLGDGDVLFNRTNSFEWVGRTGIYYKNDDVNRVFASYLVRLTPNTSFILPEYLTTFLNTKFGMADIRRRARQSINQTNVNPEEVKEIRIPILDMEFQQEIATRLQNANQKRVIAQNLYSSAENYLLECLGMQDFVANPDAYNIKTLKESFLESGRIDAEYYLPKYDDLEKLIASFEYAKLADLCTLIDHGKQPPYVEGGEIRVFSQKWIGDKGIDYGFIDSTEEPMTSCSFARDNSEYVCRQNDIVYYSVGANIGYCHNYLSDVPMMPGSFITIIRANESKINPLYLGFVLNSFIGRTQAEKRKSGTAQPYIYPKDLKEFIIPLIRPEVQAEIAQHIQRSFALRKEASQLLEEAKLSVEQAIEIGGG